MPNTIAHIGAQALGTRSLLRTSDGVWILAACVVPDLPWVLQQALEIVGGVDPYALRFYAIAQASLFVCLVVCGALAALAREPGRAFAVLALGSLLHLLLDATQEKFGNGVHLLAPLRWDLLHFDWYSPESAPTLALTLLGVAGFVRLWREPPTRPFCWTRQRLVWAACLALVWALLPLALMGGPESTDAHSTTTLRDRAQRAGRSVSFDRRRYIRRGQSHQLRTWAGESIELIGAPLGEAGVASVHGRFLDAGRVEVTQAREHPPGVRDGVSVLGLLAIGAYWVRALRRDPPGVSRIRRTNPVASSGAK